MAINRDTPNLTTKMLTTLETIKTNGVAKVDGRTFTALQNRGLVRGTPEKARLTARATKTNI